MPNEIPGTQERIAANQRFAQQMLELQYLQGRLSAQDKVNQARQELEGRLQLQREADTTRRAIATEKDVTARKKIASDETKIDKQIKDRQERDRANRAVSEGNLAERRRRNKNVERLRGMTIENSAANEQAKMYYAAIKESGDMYQSRDTEYNAAMKFLAQIQAKISDQNTKAEADKTGNTPRADQGLMDQRTTVANNVLRLEKERDTAKDLNDLSQEKLLMLLRTNPAKPGTTTGTAGAGSVPPVPAVPLTPQEDERQRMTITAESEARRRGEAMP
ncbi:MAG TPA: hypothetical protein VNA25_24240, partial [Phycisphaerae bacterium]|nr:hypothetical protein [Phycisphaerae bacterium]